MVCENGDECCDEIGIYHPAKKLVAVVPGHNVELNASVVLLTNTKQHCHEVLLVAGSTAFAPPDMFCVASSSTS